MSEQFSEEVEILNRASNVTITLDGQTGDVTLGGYGVDGEVIINSEAGKERAHLYDGTLTLGGNGTNGILSLRNHTGEEIFRLHAGQGLTNAHPNITLGGNDVGCILSMKNDEDKERIRLDADHSQISLRAGRKETIRLDGEAEYITLANANIAIEFEVSDSEEVEPGSVMVLNPDGTVQQCRDFMDERVVGVVTGADGHKPGLILNRKNSQNNRVSIALMGVVYCKVMATDTAPIEVGTMLTTSPKRGFAMRPQVLSQSNTAGSTALIGKALAAIESGTGLIPILVTLQ